MDHTTEDVHARMDQAIRELPKPARNALLSMRRTRLERAAPCLLEACKLALPVPAIEHWYTDETQPNSVAHVLRAAIAKATEADA